MQRPIIYLKAEEGSFLNHPDVHIRDVASVYCADRRLEQEIRNRQIYTFEKEKEGRIFVSILILIRAIEEIVPNGEVQTIGEQDLVISYQPEGVKLSPWFYRLKVGLICVTCFLGTGVSIMEYNNDVDLAKILDSLYEIFTGVKANGQTFVPFFYSVGLMIGIFVFFNHVPGSKIKDEPTPIQVQMRLYERDVNKTFVLDASRNGEELDVDIE